MLAHDRRFFVSLPVDESPPLKVDAESSRRRQPLMTSFICESWAMTTGSLISTQVHPDFLRHGEAGRSRRRKDQARSRSSSLNNFKPAPSPSAAIPSG